MTNPATLKPCPFCGGKAMSISFTPNGSIKIHCDSCGADGPRANSEAVADKKWNMRGGSND